MFSTTTGEVAASPRLVGLGPKWLSYRSMYYVYVLYSDTGKKLYKGFTEDLKRRLAEHNRGGVTSTKAWSPWKLLYYEVFADKTDALREELFLKSGKGKERLRYLLENTLKKRRGG